MYTEERSNGDEQSARFGRGSRRAATGGADRV